MNALPSSLSGMIAVARALAAPGLHKEIAP